MGFSREKGSLWQTSASKPMPALTAKRLLFSPHSRIPVFMPAYLRGARMCSRAASGSVESPMLLAKSLLEPMGM